MAVAIVSGCPEPEGGLPEAVDLWLLKPVRLKRLCEVVTGLLSR